MVSNSLVVISAWCCSVRLVYIVMAFFNSAGTFKKGHCHGTLIMVSNLIHIRGYGCTIRVLPTMDNTLAISLHLLLYQNFELMRLILFVVGRLVGLYKVHALVMGKSSPCCPYGYEKPSLANFTIHNMTSSHANYYFFLHKGIKLLVLDIPNL